MKRIFLLINIIFFLYFAFQLLVFTDEFALSNIGFFNHAVAGLAEIIGIIFLSISIGLGIVFFQGLNRQFPFFLTIFLIQFIIGINFWRYVFTNSSGETTLEIIFFNAILFSIASLLSLYNLVKGR
tara:strand:- start:509 stop:886 length:378 start_codon:yes stop_codon:yes gene_type:complete